MARCTYLFGDVLTGRIIEEISLQGVSMIREFGGGDLRAAFQLDQTGKNNRDLLAATEAGRCYVVAEREGTPVWGGIVWSRTYQSQAKIFQIYCIAYEKYPYYRLIRSNFIDTTTEQRNIFRSLWSAMMADSNSLQVDIPSSFPNAVIKSLDIRTHEFKTYGEAMDSIANGDNGFDWTIDINRVGGVYTKTLRIGYPTLGATSPVIIDYPGSMLNYWQNDTMAGRGTHIFGLGSGEGSTMLVQSVTHSDLLAANFPRYDVEIPLKSVTSSSILSSLTTQAAIIRKPGVPGMTIEIKGDLDPVFGSYGLGDAIRIYFNDPRHPDPVNRTFNSRILGWEYYPASNDYVEFARLTLEGEEL